MERGWQNDEKVETERGGWGVGGGGVGGQITTELCKGLKISDARNRSRAELTGEGGRQRDVWTSAYS